MNSRILDTAWNDEQNIFAIMHINKILNIKLISLVMFVQVWTSFIGKLSIHIPARELTGLLIDSYCQELNGSLCGGG